MTLVLDLQCELLDLCLEQQRDWPYSECMCHILTLYYAVERLTTISETVAVLLSTHLLISAIFSTHLLAAATSDTHPCCCLHSSLGPTPVEIIFLLLCQSFTCHCQLILLAFLHMYYLLVQ